MQTYLQFFAHGLEPVGKVRRYCAPLLDGNRPAEKSTDRRLKQLAPAVKQLNGQQPAEKKPAGKLREEKLRKGGGKPQVGRKEGCCVELCTT
jgi:hypothetical protein